jgi:hypothetical protein
MSLKVHQTFALVDTDLLSEKALVEVTAVLNSRNGLDYCPRDQTPLGR